MTHNHFTIGVLKNDAAVTNGDQIVEFDGSVCEKYGLILDIQSKVGMITENAIPTGDTIELHTRPAYSMDCLEWRKYYSHMDKTRSLPNSILMNYVPPFYPSPSNGDKVTLHPYWGYMFYTIQGIPNFVGLLGTGKLQEEHVTNIPNWSL